ncbi:dinuclear metal center protein, YbgI/SA1388 family [Halobacteroides halobius DSM 5150]|uniref:GTP cyclohydrolase 1 type 2 homolog n=1 Tax=Halobacteroides halobius (strain ATCC 35273 / DSM 5150 / MD-1) TaxID=748449 RepID=L0KBP7_HALHC|nr:Nif3-like dinuclear metal center hexameric protein [Halobacteroides halobius]AGB41779.1 dinuclear metal center protein, YbgI/SA1388 family [Halobacteroides halobius DSM 5150]
MSVKLHQVIDLIEELAAPHLAAEWDNVGLQLGDINQTIEKLLVALDLNYDVLEEAIAADIDLIVTHHPFIFKGISNINFATPQGKIIKKAIKEDISIYVAHTNYDIASNGLNDLLAKQVGVSNLQPLKVTASENLKKIAVFVPETAIAEVREALADAGAGHIGDYSHCTFQQSGIGTFKPLEGTNPYLGTKGEVNQVKEYKLETIVLESQLNKTIDKMIKAHPYEEVAYDIYPLAKEGPTVGLGRIGHLKESISLGEYAQLVKEELDLEQIKVVGTLNSKVKKVALCSGSGADLIQTAISKGADLLVTGDIKYHQAQMAEEANLNLIDGGHYGTEKIMKEGLAEYFKEEVAANNMEVKVIESNINTNPFQVI